MGPVFKKRFNLEKKDAIRQEIEIHSESLFEEQETWSKFEGPQTSIARIAIKEHFYMGESGWYRNCINAILHDKFVSKNKKNRLYWYLIIRELKCSLAQSTGFNERYCSYNC